MSTKDHITQKHAEAQGILSSVTSHLHGTWSWVKYGFSVIGVSLVLYGILALIRNRDANKNKFI
jgi:hypothetical protein